MASIDSKRVPSPAPTYSSTFNTQEIASTYDPPYFKPPPRDNASTSDHQASPSTLQQNRNTEAISIKSDHHDPNHPHFAGLPVTESHTILPARGQKPHRMPRKRVIIPWVLATVFFLTTMWYTSILVGARFLTIIRPQSSQTLPGINIIVNGDVFHTNTSLNNVLPTATLSTSACIEFTQETTVTAPDSSETAASTGMRRPNGSPESDVPKREGACGKQGTSSALPQRRAQKSRTGFSTVVRGGS